MHNHIVICGNYGSKNLGDELILFSLIKGIKEKNPTSRITVLSANPKETSEKYEVDSQPLIPAGIRSLLKFQFFKTLKVIKSADLFILGGGGLFTDEKLHAVFIWYLQVLAASFYKKKIYICANSIGPLNTWLGKHITKKALNKAGIITVRDKSSKEIALKLSIPEEQIKITADPVFILEPKEEKPEEKPQDEFEKTFGIKKKALGLEPYASSKTILISLRPFQKLTEIIINEMPEFIDYLIGKQGFNIQLLPFQTMKDDDLKLLKTVKEKCKESTQSKIEILKPSLNFNEAVQNFQNARFVIGMRFHSLILATITQTPFISISYSQKNSSFLKDNNFKEADIKPKQLSKEELKNRFKYLQQNYSRIRKDLRYIEENQKRKAKINFDYI